MARIVIGIFLILVFLVALGGLLIEKDYESIPYYLLGTSILLLFPSALLIYFGRCSLKKRILPRFNERNSHSKRFKCPTCGKLWELDNSEDLGEIFTCSSCNESIEIEALPILEFDKIALNKSYPKSNNNNTTIEETSDFFLPTLAYNQHLNVEDLRDERENFYLIFIYIANVVTVLGLLVIFLRSPYFFGMLLFYSAIVALIMWVSHMLLYAYIKGHGIILGPNQYPQIYRLVKEASLFLGIEPPTVIIFQGHGYFELLLAKKFSRRGILIFTSNLIDSLSENRSSRELMMFIGRHLGHIKAGHYRLWFFKQIVGRLALFFYFAWWRRAHFTADRIGMLMSGSLYSAEQALAIITVGTRIATSTNFDEIVEQRYRLFESLWAWLKLALAEYPYMIDRIVRLRQFSQKIKLHASNKLSDLEIGAIPLIHRSIRSLPILIIHGRDRIALLELKDLFHRKFPQVAPIVMQSETTSANTLAEKVDIIASEVVGAVALFTPDDKVVLSSQADEDAQARARQNVIMEVGWIWGRLGRDRCLLLARGELEIPSDIHGVEIHQFVNSPLECSENIREFISYIENRVG